ncbi:hypothetical protein, partial [Acetomicrobium sp. S15 = DSM 107314]|uniref:hypothetical protein n=1 Tax=Acetomicrobium sp. S15 = DSM 107314 TaxID=2529858 RepID=UPI0018E0F7A8
FAELCIFINYAESLEVGSLRFIEPLDKGYELLPQRAATIPGVRGMFRQTGGAVSVTIATLVLHEIGNPE